MYKSQILELLKTKFEGVSTTILSRMADKAAKTVSKEEDIESAVEAITFQQIIETESDRRATDAAQTAVANYEKKQASKEGKQATKTDGGEPEKTKEPAEKVEDVPAWAKALVEQNKTIAQELANIKSSNVAKSRKQVLEAALKDFPETLRNKELKNFERMNFDSEEAFNEYLEETKTDFSEVSKTLVQENAGGIGRPVVGGASTGKEAMKAAVESWAKQYETVDANK